MQPDEEPFQFDTFTASDGYTMHYRRYPAQGRQRGQVVAIHGIQSHGGWYVGSCMHLARAGWEVLFLDRRGSGLNERARGDAPSHRRLIADLDEFIGSTCASPPFLLAISWGAKLAVGLEYWVPGGTKGLILVTPGFCPRVRLTFREKLAVGLARLVTPRRRFPIPLDGPELFTTTPEWLDFLRTDALALHEATARFLVASRQLDRLMHKAHTKIRVPVLLLLAGRDRIIENGPTKEYVKLFPTYDCRVIEYPEASHTLEFEADPLPYYRDLERWLEMHYALA
jgi:alpha-beta hydrolase superfamily lysophospholipase